MATTKLTGSHNYCEFKQEAIIGRVKKMVELAQDMDAQGLHVKMSFGNRKTTALVPSVSLIPVADCGNCAQCSKGCYDVRNVCCYDASRKQRANNHAILVQDRARYFREIEMQSNFLRFMRWHVGGDIKDYDYFGQMVGIATRVPECQFLVFTKMFDIVNEWIDNVGEIPSNLHVIFSDWRGLEMDNRHNLPVSSPVWKSGEKGPHCTDSQFWCPGNCAECAEVKRGCWAAKNGETILFEAH